jgi:hypothetical protein
VTPWRGLTALAILALLASAALALRGAGDGAKEVCEGEVIVPNRAAFTGPDVFDQPGCATSKPH